MKDTISGIGEIMADTGKDTANEMNMVDKVENRSQAEIMVSNARIGKMAQLSRKLGVKKTGMTKEIKISKKL